MSKRKKRKDTAAQSEEGVAKVGEVERSAARARENAERLEALRTDSRPLEEQRAEAMARATAVWSP